MNAQVVCHPRAGVTLTFKLKDQDAVLGRDPGIAISVPVEGVSRQHAKIRWDGKVYWLEDLTSTNGTFLNGQAAVRERLKHLDVIGLGRKIDLVFLLRAPETTATRKGIVDASLLAEGEGLAPIPIAAGEITLGRAASNNVVADPLLKLKATVTAESSAPTRVTWTASVPALSSALTLARANSSVLSSSKIVTVAELVGPRLDSPTGTPSVTVKVSSASTCLSLRIVTTMFVEVTLVRKVTVPFVPT